MSEDLYDDKKEKGLNESEIEVVPGEKEKTKNGVKMGRECDVDL